MLSQWISQGDDTTRGAGNNLILLGAVGLEDISQRPQMFYLALALMKRLLITEILESSWEGWKCYLTAASARVLLFSQGASGPGRISFSL